MSTENLYRFFFSYCRGTHGREGNAQEIQKKKMASVREIRLVICREPVVKDEDQETSSLLELQVTATTFVGQLKDKMNEAVAKFLGLDGDDVYQLPRMALTSGRRVWPDVATVRAMVLEVGGRANLKYGSIDVVLASTDLRDPPKRSPEEEADHEKLRIQSELTQLQANRTRRTRPAKLAPPPPNEKNNVTPAIP